MGAMDYFTDEPSEDAAELDVKLDLDEETFTLTLKGNRGDLFLLDLVLESDFADHIAEQSKAQVKEN